MNTPAESEKPARSNGGAIRFGDRAATIRRAAKIRSGTRNILSERNALRRKINSRVPKLHITAPYRATVR